MGDPTYAIDIPGLCRAMGIKNVVEVNAFDIETLEKTIREEVAKDEVSVIITKSPCVLLSKERNRYTLLTLTNVRNAVCV